MPEDNVAPMLDELPDPDAGGNTSDPDDPGTEREADLSERDPGANEEKVEQDTELAPGAEAEAESDPDRRGPSTDNDGINDPANPDPQDRQN